MSGFLLDAKRQQQSPREKDFFTCSPSTLEKILKLSKFSLTGRLYVYSENSKTVLSCQPTSSPCISLKDVTTALQTASQPVSSLWMKNPWRTWSSRLFSALSSAFLSHSPQPTPRIRNRSLPCTPASWTRSSSRWFFRGAALERLWSLHPAAEGGLPLEAGSGRTCTSKPRVPQRAA